MLKLDAYCGRLADGHAAGGGGQAAEGGSGIDAWMGNLQDTLPSLGAMFEAKDKEKAGGQEREGEARGATEATPEAMSPAQQVRFSTGWWCRGRREMRRTSGSTSTDRTKD